MTTAVCGQPATRATEELVRLGCQPGTAAAEDLDDVDVLVELELLLDVLA